ncbi:Phytochrome two-component sensor histidine kinase Cyanobacterial phytochrome B [Paramagnetospirillum magnetotacticum MS-1]|uniref:histidine kinase n=1 Tax=Paramagnetospirillum magnetotacticum MS-1 TaxID=272627 RepID=A0A0C2YIX3_PARME|nr:ATP-binding protein [Paramagnetospirillum magnetotacticum]KIL99689.1 Phytochrome two-component sensor histidine kinase Cyanobacterial phytochrome B [Paramagnetospirillum magnetotacticum MS-1]
MVKALPSASRRSSASAVPIKWWPLVLWGLAMGIVVAWTAVTALHDRDIFMAQAEYRTQSLADLAAEQVLRTIEGADTALKAARTQLRHMGDWEKLSQDHKSWQILRDYGDAMSAVPILYMADAQGIIRLHGQSFPFRPISIVERDYFVAHRADPADIPLISAPITGLVTGNQVIIVSRRITNPDGSFGGVVGATLKADAFQAFFQTLGLGGGAVVNLQRPDGIILARQPFMEGAVGRKVDNSKAFPAIAEGKPRGTAVTDSPLDGLSRITAFQRINRYGLIVITAIPVETVLGEWRRQTIRMSSMVGVGILVLSALFVMLLRRYHTEVAARAELKNSEATLNRAQSVAHIGSWQVDLPSDHVRWSQETYRIFGITPGTPVTFTTVMAMVHPDDRAQVQDAISALLTGAPYDVEHRVITAGGEVKYVAAKALLTTAPTGEPQEILGTVQDITEKKQAEIAIREHQALLLEVQSVAKLGYYDYDIRTDLWRSSPILDTIFGITTDYIRTGQGWLELVAPAMRAEMGAYLLEIQAGQHDFDKVYPIIRPCDGEERWVAGLGKIERDAEGRPTRMVGTIKDITEQHRAEQSLRDKADELERSNTELEQFAYVASHDLREPLRMVSSYVDLLARRYNDKLDDDAREFIAFAKDGATRMDRLILELLEYSRIGRVTRPMLPVSLGGVVERALRALAPKIEECGAEFATPPEVLPTVLGDAEELMRLFQNLIGNAIKYRDPERKPVISIEAENTGKEWILTVIDNGIGIEPKYFERVFLIFQRLHRRGEYEGTGIGLAVCKKIVEHHGGRIWVESTPGQGSRFSVTLPPIGQV